MSVVRFISDLHFGHKNIGTYTGQYRGGSTDVEDCDRWLIEQWNSVVSTRDIVWVLGDICFHKKHLHNMDKLNGEKNLIFGNHDTLKLVEYQKYFKRFHGFKDYKGFLLSHSPVLDPRGKLNIHGHTHSNKTYCGGEHYCVCVEALEGKPITLDEVLKDMWNYVQSTSIANTFRIVE